GVPVLARRGEDLRRVRVRRGGEPRRGGRRGRLLQVRDRRRHDRVAVVVVVLLGHGRGAVRRGRGRARPAGHPGDRHTGDQPGARVVALVGGHGRGSRRLRRGRRRDGRRSGRGGSVLLLPLLRALGTDGGRLDAVRDRGAPQVQVVVLVGAVLAGRARPGLRRCGLPALVLRSDR